MRKEQDRNGGSVLHAKRGYAVAEPEKLEESHVMFRGSYLNVCPTKSLFSSRSLKSTDTRIKKNSIFVSSLPPSYSLSQMRPLVSHLSVRIEGTECESSLMVYDIAIKMGNNADDIRACGAAEARTIRAERSSR